jgi:hypothetical protein
MRLVLLIALLAVTGCKKEDPDIITLPPDSPLRAMTPAEYNNTVRDLLGMPVDGEWPEYDEDYEAPFWANDVWPWPFPDELGVEGFDGLADGQVVSPYLVEQYQQAAATFSQYAAVSPIFYTCDWTATSDPATCGWNSVRKFTQRAWRRDIRPDEDARLRAFWDANLAEWGADAAIQLTVQGVLQTPQFLYLLEYGAPVEGQREVPLSDFEMASRLSYLIYDSMPDPALFEAAAVGQLSTAAEVDAQARRMLEDPRARSAIVEFHRQWLELDDAHLSRADYATYWAMYGNPDEFGDDLQDMEEAWSLALIGMRASMIRESELFIAGVLFEGQGTLGDLLTDPHGYTSDRTSALYGVTDSDALDGPRYSLNLDDGNLSQNLLLQPFAFPSDQRAGILTHPAVLTGKAHPVHPAPILRGKFLLERVTCQPLGQPPDSAAGTAPPDTLDPNSSNRERIEAITTSAECAGCHSVINPAGFAFEHYDSLGGYRAEDGGKPVDASGSFEIGGEKFSFTNAIDLSNQLAQSRVVEDCYTLHWVRYATGVTIQPEDPGVPALAEAFHNSGGHVRELIVSIATSDLFRYRAGGM